MLLTVRIWGFQLLVGRIKQVIPDYQLCIDGRPWSMSTNVKKTMLDASLKIKAGSAELIAGTAFQLPPVLCFQWRVNCWELIPASAEIQQDVDRNDADMANTGTWKFWPYNHIRRVTRCFSAEVRFTHDEPALIDCQVWTGLLGPDGERKSVVLV